MSGSLFADALPDMRSFEKLARRRGFRTIAGLDEAGRGALAGPVVAAAVILPDDGDFEAVDDSKRLSPRQRDALFDVIMEQAVAVGIGLGDHILIDRINILQATLRAMETAVANLAVEPDYLLIDGISSPSVAIPGRTIKKGDSASLSIAAASIIAKVTRDRLMEQFGEEYPGYGFQIHKGYGSCTHLKAIAELGPCDIHRKSFRGVREFVSAPE